MKQVPDSLLAFQHMFPDDDACAAWLIEMRWPDGFVCPACGHEKGWALRRKAHTFECAGCRRQTSVTAGTILHASKLPLTVWFWAAYLMATHSNGISALQLQKQLGIGSYRSAWLLAHKLRASMVDPERNSLSGLVEIDEASLPFRTKRRSSHRRARTQPRRQDAHRRRHRTRGRKHPRPPAAGRNLLLRRRRPRTLRRNRPPIPTPSRKPTAGPATLRSPPIATMSMSSGKTAAHLVLPWIHQVFSNLKGWARGVYHGLRRKHLQAYLDEFVFRFNRRKTRHAAFRSLFRLATNAKPLTYSMLIEPGAMCISGTYFRADDGVSSDALSFGRSVDMRYFGQEHTVTVSIDDTAMDLATILSDFHAAHERALHLQPYRYPRRIRHVSPDRDCLGAAAPGQSDRRRGPICRGGAKRAAAGRLRRRRDAMKPISASVTHFPRASRRRALWSSKSHRPPRSFIQANGCGSTNWASSTSGRPATVRPRRPV